MTAKRKICVITGSRAEYGLMRATLKLLAQEADLSLIVTGSHLSKEHGYTVTEIHQDGFNIFSEADAQLTDTDCPAGLTMGFILSKIAHDLDKLRPEIVVCVGDRYEMAAAAMAAVMCKIPVAHIGGGELSAGSIDDSLRHAITKLSYWHLVSTVRYADRVKQLGEDPARIYLVGAPGIDSLTELMSRKVALSIVDIKKVWQDRPRESSIILFSWQPETLGNSRLSEVLASLDKLRETTVIMCGANADDGGYLINQQLIAYATSREGILFRKHFPHPLWVSLMHHADLVIGNSSAGVIEAPVLGIASIDIGIRQQGRIKPESVATVDCNTASIDLAMSIQMGKQYSPSDVFGIPGEVARNITDVLLSVEIPTLPIKTFRNI